MKNGQVKTHISASQVKTFNNCEAKWYFNKILNIRVIPNGARALGISFDEALNHNFEQKVKTGLDLKPDIVVDVFTEQYKKVATHTDFGKEKKADLRETGIQLVKLYQQKASPKILPRLVQPEFTVSFEGVDWDVELRPDLITKDGIIIDNKTTTRSPMKNLDGKYFPCNEDDKFQLTTYDICINNSKQVIPKTTRIIYAVKKKDPVIIEVDLDPPKPTDKKYWTLLVSQAKQRMNLIKEEKLSPRPNRSSYLCSRTWCGFWDKCEKQFGGRVKQ